MPVDIYGNSSADIEHDEGATLKAAIRAFTVEADGDKPNGRAEAAIDLLSRLLDPRAWPGLTGGQLAILAQANGAAAALCMALADDTEALRAAAEAYFGGDFRREAPDAPR